ncbi:Small ubiquitin-related modifier, SUMO [Corchorus olitorius]|uniref:Small ubiquitin-related modifier, SUMO n=1 Tax=Corchorus olitorius TaxID=93759 RepID=A0A1R3J1C7_9ROSI|nr:Small ubiquitin-related modifier, SUMO [Corchorus olitorius]
MSQSPSQSQSGGRANGNASAGDPIRLTMAGQDGSRVVYRIPRKCKFFKLFKDYCQKKNLDYHTARFLLNGHRIQGKYTPEKVKNSLGTSPIHRSALAFWLNNNKMESITGKSPIE